MGNNLENGAKHSNLRSRYEKSVGLGRKLLETNPKPQLRTAIPSLLDKRDRNADQTGNPRGSDLRIRKYQSIDSGSKREGNRS